MLEAAQEREPPITTTSSAVFRYSSRGPLLYCFTLLLLPLLAIPAFIGIGRSDFFIHHGASVWVQSNDAVFQMTNRDCDVLIFGDSTAMTGINPEVVEHNTGYKTCNISVTNAVLAVTDNLTLNHYLSHNAKPKVLLVQFSPDGFQRENHSWHSTIYAEGMLELMRHGTARQKRHVLLTHPREAIAFAGYAAGFSAFYAIKETWFHLTRFRLDEDTITVRNGFFTPPTPPRTSCDVTAALSSSSQAADFSRALVDGYHSQYAGQSGVVLVNVAPIPSCDRNLAVYSSELRGVTSNSLLPLPIGLFNDGRHYTAVGSTIVSRLVAQELNEVVGHNPSANEQNQPLHSIASLRRVRYRPRRH